MSTIDFRYITDVITKEEAIILLKEKRVGKDERVKELLEKGYPAYTTQVGKFRRHRSCNHFLNALLKT